MTKDQWHEAAILWVNRAEAPLLTTDYVLLELADGLARPEWRATFEAIYDELLRNADVRILFLNRQRFSSAGCHSTASAATSLGR